LHAKGWFVGKAGFRLRQIFISPKTSTKPGYGNKALLQ